MTLDVSDHLPFGPLEMAEVYFEHEGPKLFALRSPELGIRVLCVAVDEDPERNTVDYLYVALGPTRFQQIRAGTLTLREAFAFAAPGQIWRVVENYRAMPAVAAVESVLFDEVPESDLPDADARLAIATPTAPALDTAELADLATQGLRAVAAIELDPTGDLLTEFSLRGLSRVGLAAQESLDALAQEEDGEPTDRGPIAKSITDDVQMSVLALRAASFAIVIGTDKRGGLLDNQAKVEPTLARLLALVDAGQSPDVLVESMRQYGARARSKFTNLLRAVFAHESGIGLVTASQSGQIRSTQMTSRQVVSALRIIDAVEATRNELNLRRATLLGSNTRRGTFELFDNATGIRYGGDVASEARPAIDGLSVGHSSFVSARILEEVDFAAEDQETGRKYTLLAIDALEE